MKFQRINRADPEKIFVVCKNAYSVALSAGQFVSWALNGTDDGLAVTRPTTALLPALAGCVSGAIAVSGYGEIQVYGINSDSRVDGGTVDIVVGAKLAGVNDAFNVVDPNATEVVTESGLVIAAQTYTTATSAAKKTFLRMM